MRIVTDNKNVPSDRRESNHENTGVLLEHAAGRAPESRAARTLREVFESGRPLTYIRSAEEQRIARVLAEVAAGPVGAGGLPVLPGASRKV